MKIRVNTREEFALRAAKHWHRFWCPLHVGPLGTLLCVILPEAGSRGYFAQQGRAEAEPPARPLPRPCRRAYNSQRAPLPPMRRGEPGRGGGPAAGQAGSCSRALAVAQHRPGPRGAVGLSGSEAAIAAHSPQPAARSRLPAARSAPDTVSGGGGSWRERRRRPRAAPGAAGP